MEFEVLGLNIPVYLRSPLDIGELPKVVQFDNMAMLEKNDTPSDHFPPPLTVRELLEAYKKGDVFGGIFDDGNQLLAYFWFEVRVGELYISSMAVHPNYRNRGISQQILTVVDDEARKRGLNGCTLSVDPFNGRGISAYFKNGYRIVGYKTAYFGQEYPNTDRFLMEKQLYGKSSLRNEVVEVECDDVVPLNEVLSNGFIGESLIRSEDRNDRKNKIVFRK